MMPKAAVYNLITVGLQVDSTIVYIKRSDQQTAVSNSCRNWCKLGYPYSHDLRVQGSYPVSFGTGVISELHMEIDILDALL